MKKPAQSKPVPSWRGDLRSRTDLSQPPDYRTYSPEVTSFEQSPGSSRSRGAEDVLSAACPYIIIENSPRVKRNFTGFSKNLLRFFGGGVWYVEYGEGQPLRKPKEFWHRSHSKGEPPERSCLSGGSPLLWDDQLPFLLSSSHLHM